MAPTRGTNAKLLIDEFDFSCDTNSLTVTLSTDTAEHSSLCSTGKEFAPLLPDGTIEHAGYYSGKGAGYIEAELQSRLGTATAVYVAALFGTATTGCPAYVLPSTWGSQLTINAPVTDLINLTGAWPSGTSKIVRGLRIYTGTLSATGGTASIDTGAAGSAGGLGYLFVQTITGTATNATIDIESSATTGGVYASEGTFTFSAVGVQTLTMSSTVNRWLRLNTTSMGGATSFVVVAIGCVSGVTY